MTIEPSDDDQPSPPPPAARHITPTHNLAVRYPDVAAEWHPRHNGSCRPEDVAPQSNRRMWWLCGRCGHEWCAQVNNRTRGRGCPACSGRTASPGHNFAAAHPAAAAEWHPTKNGALQPTQVSPSSGRKAWWLCSTCGHEFHTIIASRARGGGCPRCANRRRGAAKATPLPGKSLADIRPDLAAQWLRGPNDNPQLRPDQTKPGSNTKPWWRCPTCAHQWPAAVASRTAGRGCPACTGLVVTATNNLAAQYPELAAEWHPTRNADAGGPQNVSTGGHTKRWWKCRTCGHEWTARPGRRAAGQGCPRCARARSRPPAKHSVSLARGNAQLAAQWLRGPDTAPQLRPEQVAHHANIKPWWKCPTCEHEWAAALNSRAAGNGCPACANQAVTATNNLAAQYPELAAEWHPTRNNGVQPRDVIPGSHRKRWWQCTTCGHDWAVAPGQRLRGYGCPPCGRRRAAIARSTPKPGQSLADLHPHLVGEWLRGPDGQEGLRPDQVKPGSNRQPWWKCATCGHEWPVSVAHRAAGGGCGRCAANRTSHREQQIIAELRTHAGWPIGEEARVTVPGRRTPYHCDAVIPAWMLIVEYDGSYWHRTAAARLKDERKTRHLAAAGWRVIRIRENLSPITDLDVCIADRLPDTAVADVVAHVIARAAALGCQIPVGSAEYRAIHDRDGLAPHDHIPGRPAPGTSLQERDPALVAQWHPTRNGRLTPELVSTRSGRRAWWLCPDCGHEWAVMVAHRSGGRGCPRCGRRRMAVANATPKPGESFAEMSPTDDWHPTRNGALRPEHITAFSHTKRWWLCTCCGHEWTAPPSARLRGYGCPPCGFRRSVLVRVVPQPGQSLADLHPAIAAEWQRGPDVQPELRPDEVKPRSTLRPWWRCRTCSHEWSAAVGSRVSGRGCPGCTARVATATNSLAAQYPRIAAQWHPTFNGDLRPDQVVPGTTHRAVWLCPACGHHWVTAVRFRVRGSGCPNGRNHRFFATATPGSRNSPPQ